MDKITNHGSPNTRTARGTVVEWKDGLRPTACPWERGSLFMVKGSAAWVLVDGSPAMVARAALRIVK